MNLKKHNLRHYIFVSNYVCINLIYLKLIVALVSNAFIEMKPSTSPRDSVMDGMNEKVRVAVSPEPNVRPGCKGFVRTEVLVAKDTSEIIVLLGRMGLTFVAAFKPMFVMRTW